jgi:dTDP-4-dehydrorhamnose 3,5-epimerase
MKITKTPLPGLLIIEPKVFADSRGYFYESFKRELLEEAAEREISFVQDNQSKSAKNVLRGLHFQEPPYAQGKLVSVAKGEVLDIAVDIRLDSPTYGQHFSITLSDNNHLSLWVPEGFAHGFIAKLDDTIFTYKCTNYYHKDSENSIIWNDEDLKIDWNCISPLVSEKDEMAQRFSTFVSQF